MNKWELGILLLRWFQSIAFPTVNHRFHVEHRLNRHFGHQAYESRKGTSFIPMCWLFQGLEPSKAISKSRYILKTRPRPFGQIVAQVEPSRLLQTVYLPSLSSRLISCDVCCQARWTRMPSGWSFSTVPLPSMRVVMCATSPISRTCGSNEALGSLPLFPNSPALVATRTM